MYGAPFRIRLDIADPDRHGILEMGQPRVPCVRELVFRYGTRRSGVL